MRTDTLVKQEGLNALISCLGYVDAERFIVLMNKEPFDYTKWREIYLDDDDMQKVLEAAREQEEKEAVKKQGNHANPVGANLDLQI